MEIKQVLILVLTLNFNRVKVVLSFIGGSNSMQKYKYNKLKGRIVEIYGSQKSFAKAFGIAENSMSLKLTGQTQFTQEDIEKAADLLSIDRADYGIYFFA